MTTDYRQPSFADLGEPLSSVSFCVVDLETTGTSPEDHITEIGAVRIHGGETTGEFQTLVQPPTPIPALITALTGITSAMVASAPSIAEVLPSFLEFAKGCVLVAHNARFDVGFLKRACAVHAYDWPNPAVVDTVGLARKALLRGEVPNHKLGTLAGYFRTMTSPTHRALDDARATVDVLHALLERAGCFGVETLPDLLSFQQSATDNRQSKRAWARDLPELPGVYTFYANDIATDAHEPRRVLYVGKSTNIRSRVRSYFTASETRPRIGEMLTIADGVTATPCVTPLEAEIRELRLIAAHKPPYNRRSKFPEKQHWLKLTNEMYPRFSIVSKVLDDGARYFGPCPSRMAAEEVCQTVYETFPIRQCTTRLTARNSATACALAELKHCRRPCERGISAAEYAELVDTAYQALTVDVRPLITGAKPRLAQLVASERYEEAQILRNRVETVVKSTHRFHQVSSLAACPQIVAGYFTGRDWEIHVIRFGRLAGAALASTGEDPRKVAEQTTVIAETVLPALAPQPAASLEETTHIAAWLERPGVRLIDVNGDWHWPLHGSIPREHLARYLVG